MGNLKESVLKTLPSLTHLGTEHELGGRVVLLLRVQCPVDFNVTQLHKVIQVSGVLLGEREWTEMIAMVSM